MQKVTNVNLKSLSLLEEKFSLFPPSDPKSTMTYDYNKLSEILQDKEIKPFDNNGDGTEKVYILTREFGQIAAEVARNPSIASLQAYFDLDKRVEENLNGNFYLYAKQWGLSVKALYFYKLGEFQRAIDYTLECIALNEYLMTCGIHTLMLRCAEQNRNISRIYFKSGNWDEGARMANSLLRFLFNNDTDGLHGKTFVQHAYWAKTPYVREGYAYECFRGFVSQMVVLSKLPKAISLDLFSMIFSNLEIDANSIDRVFIYNWLELKHTFRLGEHEKFINDLIDYFDTPMSFKYEILKVALYDDLIEVIKNSNYHFESRLLEKVNDYFENKLLMSNVIIKDIGAKNNVTGSFERGNQNPEDKDTKLKSAI
ncbi:hypothetical protein [Pedobacter sp. GR22-10]|uniref:hypothetical protein n=1 Tax=Pedobacter sp. GR22-10 TaxID=2994472 RepID=UPI002245960F|nr:hypothetical protein [Pedobacter sp. GR22-10]MCX2432963.1 hypothetical protein [Pedobacter sp. GR22-10]